MTGSEEHINILDGIEGNELRAMAADELLSSELLLSLYDISDFAERARVRALIILAARSKGIEKDIKAVLKAYDAEDIRLGRDYLNGINNETDFSFEPDTQLSCGAWIADDNGVRMQKKDGEISYASMIPIVPVALMKNISTGKEKVKLSFFKKGKQSIICERKVVSNASKIIDLSSDGIEVTSDNAKLLVRYISDCITNNLDRLPYYNAFSQLGWNEHGFTPYSSEAKFDGEEENRYLYKAVSQKGKLEDWIAQAAQWRKNMPIRLAMDAALSSVLIEKVGALPYVFHLWGKTGTGKTVALKVAMSIWGNPALGKMVRTMNMTQNSMLSTAAFLNSLPFAGDELQTIKTRWDSYDQLIMRITEGIDRGRMSFDKNNETKSWRCAFLFTGEDPCTNPASGGGVKNRVIELEVSDKLFENGNEVSNFVDNNYGHAGKRFVEYVSKLEADSIKQQFQSFYKAILSETDTTEKQAVSMALILTADKLSCDCLFDGEPLTVKDIAQHLITDKEVDVGERAYEYIINHIAANGNRFCYSENHGEIWGAKRGESTVIFNALILRRELSNAGFEFDAVKKKWAAQGYITLTSDGRYAHNLMCNREKARYVIINQPSPDSRDVNDTPDDYDDIDF